LKWGIKSNLGHTVSDVVQIDALPEPHYARPAPRLEPLSRIEHAGKFFAPPAWTFAMAGPRAYSWRRLCELRQQLEAIRHAKGSQPRCSSFARIVGPRTSAPPPGAILSRASSTGIPGVP